MLQNYLLCLLFTGFWLSYLRLHVPYGATRRMARSIVDTDFHNQAMQRLCFVCTGLIKGQHFNVDECADLLRRGLKVPELFVIPGVTPYHFCKNCHRTVQLAASGNSIRSTRSLQEWSECTENCSSCLLLSKKKSGGSKKKVSFFFI